MKIIIKNSIIYSSIIEQESKPGNPLVVLTSGKTRPGVDKVKPEVWFKFSLSLMD